MFDQTYPAKTNVLTETHSQEVGCLRFNKSLKLLGTTKQILLREFPKRKVVVTQINSALEVMIASVFVWWFCGNLA